MTLTTRQITTRQGIDGEVLQGGSGPDLVWLHGAGGTTADDPLLKRLTERYTVHAPIWPGYGPHETEHHIETMLDFTLHGWDVIDALELSGAPVLAGHSMGGMIAAEMAAIAPHDLARLVLLAPAGLWDDAMPVPDIFTMLPYQLAEVLFRDAAVGEKLLTAGRSFDDDAALAAFMVDRARQLGTAGKILFPIPNRGLARRLYRIGMPTTIIWGESDRLYPLAYADHWSGAIADCTVETVAEAGHMVVVEQPDFVAARIG